MSIGPMFSKLQNYGRHVSYDIFMSEDYTFRFTRGSGRVAHAANILWAWRLHIQYKPIIQLPLNYSDSIDLS